MAIQNRRGNKIDFDPNKLVAGEFGYALDTGELYYCYSPGNVKRLLTSEDVQEILNTSESAYSALQKLILDLETNPSEITNILNSISNLQTTKLDKTGNAKDNTVTFAIASTDTDIASGNTLATIFSRILKSINIFRSAIGTLSALATVDKTSLVKAINEINSGKIDKVNIANNLVSTNTDLVLGAPQGKELKTRIDAINNNLALQSGSFTPKIDNVGAVHSLQQGYYTKISNTVFFTVKIGLTTKPTGASADLLLISGLPFVPSANSIGKTLFNVKCANMTTAMADTVGSFVDTANLTISKLSNNSTSFYSGLKLADLTGTTHVWISGYYFTN